MLLQSKPGRSTLKVLKYKYKYFPPQKYLRANLFKNQADLYWRVIYDPLRFARIFFGWKAYGEIEESQIFRSLDQTDFFLGNLEKSIFWGEILIIKKIAFEIKISQCT